MAFLAAMALIAFAITAHPAAADTFSPLAAGIGLGIALAGAPGPVQAIILTESVRGGVSQGARAQLGANVTFGVLLLGLALGVSVVAPTGVVLRILKVAGGAFLLILAGDGIRSQQGGDRPPEQQRGLPPAVQGIFAVIFNPGAWLFLGTAASSLFSAAAHNGGTPSALVAAAALTVGLAIGDGAVVLLGGIGVRRAGERVALVVRRILAIVLAALGIGLVVSGLIF